jgi:hypothetical protein
MGRLYGVPQQWDRNEQQIVDIATAKINEQIEADRDDGIAINAEVEFQAMLEKLCQRMARQQGRQHYFVPATGWLMWAKDNFTDKLWPKFHHMAGSFVARTH